ncbi:hypothetical protein [Nocardioides sp.]|uniref:HNH endonuclease n=1 Tax=Nocardioides sp. TaxID=35761 RepID=UPI00351330CD
MGDNAATYPKLLQIAAYPGADDRAVNEVFGWLYRCATQSAAWLTDYVIDSGTAHMLGGARTPTLARWCVRAGLLTPIKASGIPAWVLLNDPAFIHIRTKVELEWEAQRRADTSNTHITVPVRARDGDQCRYCGIVVQWSGPKTNRRAEYDHRHFGQAATVDTLVVACRSCNGARSNDPEWDLVHPIRAAPDKPFYGKTTATFLTRNGRPTVPNFDPDALIDRFKITAANPGDAAEGAHPGQARPGARPPEDTRAEPADTAADRADAATGAQHGPGATPPPSWATEPPPEPAAAQDGPGARESPPESPQSLPTVSESSSAKSGLTGSGREGTDREAPPHPPPHPPASPPRPARRRGSRGSRKPPPPTEGHPQP